MSITSLEDMQEYLEEWEYEIFIETIKKHRPEAALTKHLYPGISPAGVVGGSFQWTDTEQGKDFWQPIYRRLKEKKK